MSVRRWLMTWLVRRMVWAEPADEGFKLLCNYCGGNYPFATRHEAHAFGEAHVKEHAA